MTLGQCDQWLDNFLIFGHFLHWKLPIILKNWPKMVQKYAKHQMKNEKQPMNFNIMPKWRNFATSGHSALGSLYDTSSLSSTSCRSTRSRGEVGDGFRERWQWSKNWQISGKRFKNRLLLLLILLLLLYSTSTSIPSTSPFTSISSPYSSSSPTTLSTSTSSPLLLVLLLL